MLPVERKPAVTASVVEPLMAPDAASMVVDPSPTAFARPLLLIAATPVAEEIQVTELVRFCVLPSVYVPVAVNCCGNPAAIDGFAGVTAIDTSAGGATVSVVDP